MISVDEIKTTVIKYSYNNIEYNYTVFVDFYTSITCN